jgi:hypothetical protein
VHRDPKAAEVLIEWTDARQIVHKAIVPEIALLRHARKDKVFEHGQCCRPMLVPDL